MKRTKNPGNMWPDTVHTCWCWIDSVPKPKMAPSKTETLMEHRHSSSWPYRSRESPWPWQSFVSSWSTQSLRLGEGTLAAHMVLVKKRRAGITRRSHQRKMSICKKTSLLFDSCAYLLISCQVIRRRIPFLHQLERTLNGFSFNFNSSTSCVTSFTPSRPCNIRTTPTDN